MTECLTAKSKIQATFNEVAELASQKNEKVLKQETVNKFLDKILELQNHLTERTNKINHINTKFQEISWLRDIDADSLTIIRKILDLSKLWHNKLIKHYVNLNWARKDYATEAMRKFKIEIDDLKERNQDLEDLFFNLPADIEFTQRIEKLSK
ncbi:putative nucleic acid-binding Zn-ribbon protein [Flavobacterium sp. CG_9.1]|uniref:hypothetical protein n=1 Tax=Flavobacterium sp. CG_9.1 TaxID=2787728 RepID=UPI0018CA9CD6|nr:hypothetical protein [Flavobacterium sp. CG_9.1]MBG6063700.1 putative nucleic acid-binding Zn-ribbon protein [Flavobacterium sp. CG_9.1]